MKFTDELERLLAVGSDFTIRGLLQDNAPALLELVRAAEDVIDMGIGGPKHAALDAALARLEPK